MDVSVIIEDDVQQSGGNEDDGDKGGAAGRREAPKGPACAGTVQSLQPLTVSARSPTQALRSKSQR